MEIASKLSDDDKNNDKGVESDLEDSSRSSKSLLDDNFDDNKAVTSASLLSRESNVAGLRVTIAKFLINMSIAAQADGSTKERERKGNYRHIQAHADLF